MDFTGRNTGPDMTDRPLATAEESRHICTVVHISLHEVDGQAKDPVRKSVQLPISYVSLNDQHREQGQTCVEAWQLPCPQLPLRVSQRILPEESCVTSAS
ncbi:uncharacterized protein LOC144580675 isoform X2 [Callithrix jacchus]